MARLIDLGEALRMVQNSKDDCPETSIKGRAIWETAHNCAISCLTNCDTVDAVPVVHGRWVEDTATDMIACTECGHAWSTIDNCTETFNYCPNCGADMREVEQ